MCLQRTHREERICSWTMLLWNINFFCLSKDLTSCDTTACETKTQVSPQKAQTTFDSKGLPRTPNRRKPSWLGFLCLNENIGKCQQQSGNVSERQSQHPPSPHAVSPGHWKHHSHSVPRGHFLIHTNGDEAIVVGPWGIMRARSLYYVHTRYTMANLYQTFQRLI